MNHSEQEQWKKDAAEAAAKLVENGMVVGLGTGSTAAFFLRALARACPQNTADHRNPNVGRNGASGARPENSTYHFCQPR